ncbi:MAG: hypothetical protein JNK79_15875 [Chitinophagaceae bacterium]|nr:hypothetical protein [Chitinophagaceae bacterium]
MKNKVHQETIMTIGSKQVIRFMAVPAMFPSEKEAIFALHRTVETYEATCGKGYNTFNEVNNSFVVLVIHGINE